MTRLPVDTWAIIPRLDLPPYKLNEVCPVTGSVGNLEDHHIFRRSFTALGKEENQRLFWVEKGDGSCDILKNRVALSPMAHERITTNRARLEYRDTDLFYIGGEGEKKLDLDLRLMAGGEKVSKRRKPAARTPEERRANTRYLIHVPPGEQNVIPELVEVGADLLRKRMGWSEDVPPYFVITAALTQLSQ